MKTYPDVRVARVLKEKWHASALSIDIALHTSIVSSKLRMKILKKFFDRVNPRSLIVKALLLI